MKRCVIDTNVIVTANKAILGSDDGFVNKYPDLIIKCIKFLDNIKKKNGKIYVALDEDNEIFNEYKTYMNFSGQPGVGDSFFKWLHDIRWSFPETERIKLHKTENGYVEFPILMEQAGVDPSDKKFFAVSNGHPSKPDIYEAVDAKWWNWRNDAKLCGINIKFIDEQYMQNQNNVDWFS